MNAIGNDSGTMTVAVGQFAGTPDWQENLRTCLELIAGAKRSGARLLVLPEGSIRTRSIEPADDPAAPQGQPLDGPFVETLAAATARSRLTVVVGTVESCDEPRPWNTLVALARGRIIAIYRKIHLYDAFAGRESDRIRPGDGPLGVFEVGGFAVGMMTCYDIRFPEVARSLAVQGADILALPTAWAAGPLKEMHWEVMTTARALENTCYLVAAGKTGAGRVGLSAVIDPLGVAVAKLGRQQGMALATVSRSELERVRAELPLLAQRRIPTALQAAPYQQAVESA